MSDSKITRDELYELRGLLTKLGDEPDLREQVGTWINGVRTLTSVLLDTTHAPSGVTRA